MNFSPFYVKKGKGKIQVERKVKKNMEKATINCYPSQKPTI